MTVSWRRHEALVSGDSKHVTVPSAFDSDLFYVFFVGLPSYKCLQLNIDHKNRALFDVFRFVRYTAVQQMLKALVRVLLLEEKAKLTVHFSHFICQLNRAYNHGGTDAAC